MPVTYLAIDTETTGGNFREGDRPYYVSTCDSSGKLRSWEFVVTPKRAVKIPSTFVREFDDYARGKVPVFHNANFDLRALASVGVDVTKWLPASPPEKPVLHDTLIASHVFRNTGSHGLKDLALEYLDFPDDDEDELIKAVKRARTIAKRLKWTVYPRDKESTDDDGSWLKMDSWLPGNLYRQGFAPEHPEWASVMPTYGDKDVERTMALFLFFRKGLKDENLWGVYLEQLQVVPCIYDFVRLGVSLNLKSLHSELRRYEKRRDEYEEEVKTAARDPDLNLDSPKQMTQLLFNELRVPVVRQTKKGAPSLDKAALPMMLDVVRSGVMANPRKADKAETILAGLLAYRKVSTSIRYLTQYEEKRVDDRLFPGYNQTGTNTTRMSSSNPNMQNVGKGSDWEDEEGEHSDYKLRKAFGPGPDRIWFCMDYKQLQLGIFAQIVGEQSLIDGFARGFDAHDTVARRIYDIPEGREPTKEQRRDAKAVNFGYIFGKSANKLDKIKPGLGALVQEMFPTATDYLQETQRRLKIQQRQEGVQIVYTRGGYRLEVPPRDSDETFTKDRPYAGVCYEVQGTEGILVKRAMVKCRSYLNSLCVSTTRRGMPKSSPIPGVPTPGLPDAFMTFQVHDEIGFDFRRPKGWGVEKYKPYVLALKNLMEAAGASLGIISPVSVSVVEGTWDSPVELDW